MRPRHAAALVAQREIVERIRDRSLLISTAVTLAILAAILLIPPLIGIGGTTTYKVAVAGPQAEQVARAARRDAKTFDAQIEIVRVADERAVRKAVDAEKADAGLSGDARAIVVRKKLDDKLGNALQEGSRQLRLQAQPPPPLPVHTLLASDNSDDLQTITFVAVLLLYFQLVGYGYWLASGIVEEKASRIVEVLLATIRARELLAGKIVGIGIVGFMQLLVIGVGATALGVATDQVNLTGDTARAVGVVLAWFVLGYAFYACLFAVAGALVPRQEDIQNTTTPLSIVLFGSFMLSFAAIDDPGGGLATALTFIPPTAPMIAPVRLIAGEMPVEQIVVSVAVLLAGTAALVAIAARMYSNAVLRTGTRVKLLEAWRSAQS
ncbi:MAG: type transport system permease protein [Solirubrobacteraceae bacterium]|jgi:ABC-2 type transport system permease protein|nr:type transport system permease protein [Solirubrobacteraceae bacterium]